MVRHHPSLVVVAFLSCLDHPSVGVVVEVVAYEEEVASFVLEVASSYLASTEVVASYPCRLAEVPSYLEVDASLGLVVVGVSVVAVASVVVVLKALTVLVAFAVACA